MKLPRIYTHFSQGQVFTIDEARRKLGTKGNTLRKRLSDLSMRGYISPIRQGLYRLSKIGESRFEKHIHSPYEIASKLSSDCYIGYKTALQLHSNQLISENTSVYIISSTKFNCFKFDTREYIWCQTAEKYGVESRLLCIDNREFTICTTNLEKTLIDCLKRPAHCPSFHQLMELCNKLPLPPDIDKLLFYANKVNVRSIFNRMGYLIEKNQNAWNVSDGLLKKIEKNISHKQINWKILKNGNEINRWKIHFLNSNYSANSQQYV